MSFLMIGRGRNVGCCLKLSHVVLRRDAGSLMARVCVTLLLVVSRILALEFDAPIGGHREDVEPVTREGRFTAE